MLFLFWSGDEDSQRKGNAYTNNGDKQIFENPTAFALDVAEDGCFQFLVSCFVIHAFCTRSRGNGSDPGPDGFDAARGIENDIFAVAFVIAHFDQKRIFSSKSNLIGLNNGTEFVPDYSLQENRIRSGFSCGQPQADAR